MFITARRPSAAARALGSVTPPSRATGRCFRDLAAFALAAFVLSGAQPSAAAVIRMGVTFILPAGAQADFPTNGGVLRTGSSSGGGSITVNDGSQIVLGEGSDEDPGISSASFNIGRRGSFSNSLTIEGEGSLVQLDGAGYSPINGWVGRDGANGLLTIRDGGVLRFRNTQTEVRNSQSGAQLAIGAGAPPGQGDLVIDDGELHLSSDQFTSFMEVGREPGTVGSAQVTGPNGLLSLEAPNDDAIFTVARDAGSAGSVSISQNARMSVSGADARLIIGSNDGSNGDVSVAEGGQVSVTGTSTANIQIGAAFPDFGKAAAGDGALSIDGPGSQATVNGSVFVGSASRFGEGGTGSGALIVSDGGVLDAENVFIGEGGLLTGDGGEIRANVFLEGGLLSPGASPGTMTIFGDLTLAGGVLDLEPFDLLNVQGNLFIEEKTTLRINAGDGSGLTNGDIRTLLSVAGGLSLDLDLLEIALIGGGTNQLIRPIFGTAGVSLEVAPVPIPLPGALLLGGLGLLAAFRRRASA